MDKLFKNKEKRIRNLLLILIPFAVLVIVFGVLAFKSAKGLVGTSGSITTEAAFSNSIDEYDYHLRSNATDLQKELFSQLKEELSKSEKDEKKIAVLVAKNFVADFYTWSNKNGTTDVGGMYYVYSPTRRAILLQARRYMYQHLNEYIDKYGKENLLEVEEFTFDPIEQDLIKVEQYEKPEDGTYTMYTFYLQWKYKNKTGGFDTSKYTNYSLFQVYKNKDGRFEILNIGE